MAAQRDTEIRRRLSGVKADQAAVRARQDELEGFLGETVHCDRVGVPVQLAAGDVEVPQQGAATVQAQRRHLGRQAQGRQAQRR